MSHLDDSAGGDLTSQEINGFRYTIDDLKKVELNAGQSAGFSSDRGAYTEYFVSIQAVVDGETVDNDKWINLVDTVAYIAEQAVDRVMNEGEAN